MSKLVTIIFGAIVVLFAIALLTQIVEALIGIVFFVSFFIIVVGGAFLILRKIFRG